MTRLIDHFAPLLATLREGHTGGHTCTDLHWYNPNAGSRGPCPVLVTVSDLAARVNALHASVHAAAHDDQAAAHVAEGMTGFALADLVDPEEAAGWILTARRAVEALAEWLDRDPEQEQRARAAAARLTSRTPVGQYP